MRKIGIVGFGRIGRIHFNTVKKLQNVEIVAVADPFADKMVDVFDQYGVENYSDDFNEIIKRPSMNPSR